MTGETEYVLYQVINTTADGSGNASITVGPTIAHTRWKLERYSVKATGVTGGIVSFTLYRGATAGGQVIDSTPYQGQGNTSDGNNVDLYPGEYVTGVWSGASPGSACSFTIQGQQYVKGRRSY